MAHHQTNTGGSAIAALARYVEALTRFFAMVGGAILFVVAIYVVTSITSRSVGTGSLFGDFEAVKYGCGLAAFFFLPYCQWHREHIKVEIFSSWLPESKQSALDRFWELVFAAVWIVIAWRLMIGAYDAYDWEERSMIVQFPLWWIYVPAIACLILVIVAALLRMFTPMSEEVA